MNRTAVNAPTEQESARASDEEFTPSWLCTRRALNAIRARACVPTVSKERERESINSSARRSTQPVKHCNSKRNPTRLSVCVCVRASPSVSPRVLPIVDRFRLQVFRPCFVCVPRVAISRVCDDQCVRTTQCQCPCTEIRTPRNLAATRLSD